MNTYKDLFQLMTETMKTVDQFQSTRRDVFRFTWNVDGTYSIKILEWPKHLSAHEDLHLKRIIMDLEDHPLIKSVFEKRSLLSISNYSEKVSKKCGSLGFQWDKNNNIFLSFHVAYPPVIGATHGTLGPSENAFNRLMNFVLKETDKEPSTWLILTNHPNPTYVRATSEEEAIVMTRFQQAPSTFLTGKAFENFTVRGVYKEHDKKVSEAKIQYETYINSQKQKTKK